MEDRRAHDRINTLEGRLDSFEKELKANTEATQTIATNTTEIVSIIKGAKGMRHFIVWLTPVAVVFGYLWSILKDHWK